MREPSTQETEPFLASDIFEFDDPVPSYEAKDVARTWADLNLSQRALASVPGAVRTVEAWEAGRNVPSGAARHLLFLLDGDQSLVQRLVAR